MCVEGRGAAGEGGREGKMFLVIYICEGRK